MNNEHWPTGKSLRSIAKSVCEEKEETSKYLNFESSKTHCRIKVLTW